MRRGKPESPLRYIIDMKQAFGDNFCLRSDNQANLLIVHVQN